MTAWLTITVKAQLILIAYSSDRTYNNRLWALNAIHSWGQIVHNVLRYGWNSLRWFIKTVHDGMKS